MISKRYMIAETIKAAVQGGLGIIQGLASHPAGLALLGLISIPTLRKALEELLNIKLGFSREEMEAWVKREIREGPTLPPYVIPWPWIEKEDEGIGLGAGAR